MHKKTIFCNKCATFTSQNGTLNIKLGFLQYGTYFADNMLLCKSNIKN